jgi:hypothetical protein
MRLTKRANLGAIGARSRRKPAADGSPRIPWTRRPQGIGTFQRQRQGYRTPLAVTRHHHRLCARSRRILYGHYNKHGPYIPIINDFGAGGLTCVGPTSMRERMGIR